MMLQKILLNSSSIKLKLFLIRKIRTRMQIEQTYKSIETEETLDLILYRPIGFKIALFSKRFGLTPNTVTILSGITGIIAGHLFYYKYTSTLVSGIFFMMLSQALDGADGQLARMTKNYSRYGRILDGFTGNVIFVVIYLHICARLISDGYSIFIFLLVIISGLCHSIQSAMADYYRNGFLQYAVPGKKGELELSEDINKRYGLLKWNSDFGEKFLMRVYLNYTIEQEFFAKYFKQLKIKTDKSFNGTLPVYLSLNYAKKARPLVKYFNILTTNTRLTALFIALAIHKPLLYFAFEMTILNVLLVYVVYKQERISKSIIDKIDHLKEERLGKN
jgi:hypothetical protein